jgi:putative aldouronate transport system permease protein
MNNEAKVLATVGGKPITEMDVTMLIMQMGSILSNGLEQMLLFQNSMNIDVSEVLETYSYTVGLKQGRYAFGAAIGLFQSAVGCIMVFVSNYISKKTGGGGLW